LALQARADSAKILRQAEAYWVAAERLAFVGPFLDRLDIHSRKIYMQGL
jgi:hypothetical protein